MIKIIRFEFLISCCITLCTPLIALTKIHKPSGFKLLALSAFVFSSKTHKNTFEPIIADMQEEVILALAEGNFKKARYEHLKGVIAFWGNVAWYMSGNVLVKLAKKILPFLGG